MSRFLRLLVCVSFFAGIQARGQDDLNSRIAFVNMEQVFEQYYKTQRADRRLKDQALEFNTERSELIEKIEKMEADFNALREEAGDETLSKDGQDRKRSEAEAVLVELRATEQEIKQFEQTRRRQLEEQGRRMRKAIVDDIDEVIKRVASERSLFAVIDSSGPSLNQVPVFLYSDPSSDITAAIVALLNVGQDQEDDWEEDVAEDEEEKESSLEIRD
jgi:Skp family chaperone for outer membrane proteins